MKVLSAITVIMMLSVSCQKVEQKCNNSHGCESISGSENNGTWTTQCDRSSQQQLDIDVTSHTSTIIHKLIVFSDQECSQSKYSVQREYSLLGLSDENLSNLNSKGALSSAEYQLAFSTEESRAELQSQCTLDKSNWVNLEGATCIFQATSEAARSFNFNILSIEDGVALLGDTSTLDGLTEETRPTVLGSLKFFRDQ